MFVSFTYVFTPVRMVSCKGVYVISCGSFYVKLALFSELYLKLQTDFTLAGVFGFLPMTVLLNLGCSCVGCPQAISNVFYRSFASLLIAVKKRGANTHVLCIVSHS